MSDAEATDVAVDTARSSNELRPESPGPIPPPRDPPQQVLNGEESRAQMEKVMQSDVSWYGRIELSLIDSSIDRGIDAPESVETEHRVGEGESLPLE